MGHVEIDNKNLLAHALDTGVRDTVLQGELSFDRDDRGVAVVLSLQTVGEVNQKTSELRDLVMDSVRLVVRHDGVEVPTTRIGLPRLPSLKRLPRRAAI